MTTKSINELLTQYEAGSLTRRELLAAITLLAVPRPARAQASLFQARSFSHLNLRVSDLARSEQFYRDVLGFPAVRSLQGAAFGYDFPDGGFISLCPLSVPTCGQKPGVQAGEIDHIAVGVDNYDAERLEHFEAHVTKTGSPRKTGPDGGG